MQIRIITLTIIIGLITIVPIPINSIQLTDTYENNNTIETGTPITDGDVQEHSSNLTDPDYFRFDLSQDTNINIQIITEANFPIEGIAYIGSLNSIQTIRIQATTDNNTASLIISLIPGNYYIYVILNKRITTTYTISLHYQSNPTDDVYEDNDQINSAVDIPLNTQLNLTLIDDDFFNFTLTEDSYLKFSVESSNVGIELFAKLYNENNTDFAVIYNNHSDFHSQGKYTIQIGLFDQIDYIATINYTLSIKLIQPQPLSTTEILEQEINEFNYFTITTEVDARFELIIHRSDNSEYTIVLIPIIRTSRIVWDIIDYKVEGQYLYHKLTAIIEPGECIIKMHTYYENTIPYSVEYNITELVDDDDDSYETANLISDTTSIEDELYSTEYNIEHDLYFFDLTQTTNILIVLDFPYTTSMDIEVTDINFQSEELSISYRSGIITMVGVLNMGRYYIDIFSEENLNIYTLYFEELITNQIPSGYYTDQTYINHLQLGFSFLFTIETTTQFTIGYYYFINYYLLGSNTYQVYYIPPYEIIDLPPDVYYLSLSIHPDFFKLLREGNEFLINIIISMSVNLTPSQPPVNSGTSSQPINPNAPENRNTEDIEPLGVNISTTSLICGISVIIYMKRRILIKY